MHSGWSGTVAISLCVISTQLKSATIFKWFSRNIVQSKLPHLCSTLYILINGFYCCFLQSRSHLLRHTSRNRFKPFDVFREQRERRRTICNKKLASQTNCTPALSVNGCESLCSGTANIPSSCPSSDFVVDTIPSRQLPVEYSKCKNIGKDKLERKLNITDTFDKHSDVRTEFTAQTVKEQTVDGGCATCDR